jgi:four helix bundle protein
MNTHRQLVAWQICRQLVSEVYRVTRDFPADERFGIVSQLRRAAVSSAANISEGMARYGPRETARGLSMALGSLAEIDTLLAVAEDLGYLSREQSAAVEAIRDRASRLTFGLQKRMRTKAEQLKRS